MFESLPQHLKDLAESFVPYREQHELTYADSLDDIVHRGYFINKCTNLPKEKGIRCYNMYRFCKNTHSLKRIVAFGGTPVKSTRKSRNKKVLLFTETDFEEIVGNPIEFHFKNHVTYDCPCRKAVFQTDKNDIFRFKNKIFDFLRLKVYIKVFIYVIP